jgi:hypothetical protein
VFNPALQCFNKKLNNPVLFSEEVVYPLAEFVSDYYEMEFRVADIRTHTH